jgi:hypothetical protein
MSVTQTRIDICTVLDEIKELLLEKNRRYGDSAINPVRIFSKCDSIEGLKIRLDDKLSRLRTQSIEEDEDVLLDLLGYMILLRVARMQQNRTDFGVA